MSPKTKKPVERMSKSLFIEKVLELQDRILIGGKITSKRNEIWITLSRNLKHIVMPSSLYTYVVSNKYNVRDRLMGKSSPIQSQVATISTPDIHDDTTDFQVTKNGLTLTITMAKQDFQSLLHCKRYTRQNQYTASTRKHVLLKREIWQTIRDKITKATGISCVFGFNTHHMYSKGERGDASGKCKCGAVVKCSFDNSLPITKIHCIITNGRTPCGNGRPVSHDLGEKQGTIAAVAPIEIAEELTEQMEPPHHTATEKCPPEDPDKSLQLNCEPVGDVLHNIETVECPACANGDKPSGAHKCRECEQSVHAIEECSTANGKDRICQKCKKFGRREVLKKLPLIKNGNKLSPVHFGKDKYAVRNTCGFDSILQLFVSAYCDNETFHDFVQTACGKKFFKMVANVAESGVKAAAYKLRATILRGTVTNTRKNNNCIILYCETTVFTLCKQLFVDFPSFREELFCKDCDYVKIIVRDVVFVPVLDLRSGNTDSMEKYIFRTRKQYCDKCRKVITTVKYHTGAFITFEPHLKDSTRIPNLTLAEIATEIKFSFMAKPYNLVGVVNFLEAVGQVSKFSTGYKPIGHYTALSYRKNREWTLYDDLQDAEKIVPCTYKVRAAIVLYSL